MISCAPHAIPITLVEHARNFGEHNAVLTGWRHARGAHIVNLDDDGQNPPAEAVRLWQHARREGLDVVFGHYEVKQHSAWRNAGSWFTNRMTDWALDKPHGFYLSSFRCVSAFVTRQVVGYAGPYPYIDGLLLQVTQRIGSITVRHDERRAGAERLHAAPADSAVAERVAQLLAAAAACRDRRRCRDRARRASGVRVRRLAVAPRSRSAYGWGWVMAAVLVFSGTQLVMLGLIGEYLGRMFLTVNQRPQIVVREVVSNRTESGLKAQGSGLKQEVHCLLEGLA